MSHVDDGTLHAYLDGELAPVERARLEAHVAECPACRARLEEERALVERASQLLGLAQPPDRASPPPPLHQLRQPRLAWRVRIPLAWAASVMLALGLGYFLGETSDRGVPRAEVAIVDSGSSPLMPARRPAPPAREGGRARNKPPAEQAPPETAAQRVELADQLVAKALADSARAAVGAAAVALPSELRAVSPSPVAAPAAAPALAETDLAALRGRLVATEWPVIRREPARQILGADPVGIPGLALREIRRSPADDGVVLVEQQLDSATVIQLFQRRAVDEGAGRREAARAAERLARFMGPLRVEIAGPLTTDSLNKLLEQAKPLPPP